MCEIKVDANVIRYAVACWLRYTKQCDVIAFERGVYTITRGGVPDVLGISQSRRAHEIEIKTSLSDFKRDRKKDKTGSGPHYFYFAVPKDLREKTENLLLPWEGLIVCYGYFDNKGQDGMSVIKKASTKSPWPKTEVTDEKMLEMAKHQSGTLCGLAGDVINARRFAETEE